ncbi:MAG TPA: PEP/pyruvate-binding domain-containing protein [Anaeromyxobacter sp.]
MATPYPASTGLASLDGVVGGLRPGDNVVWQVDSVADYVPFVRPFVADALASGKRLVYFRFARHAPLVEDGAGAEIHRLSPTVGFESFTTSIHQVIEEAGPGAYYVFDCLSDLAADWYSDLMLGNFFMVTCPYLYELDTVTYFALLRDSHSHEAVDSIRNTTQLLVDVFAREGQRYVHPLKVFARHSPTMYLPHVQEGEAFRPLTESGVLSEVLSELAERRLDAVARHDLWDRKFQQARDALDAVRADVAPASEAREHFDGLLRMMLTRDERLAELAGRWLDLPALLAIRRRMIGTGLVGGKAVGMLVARAVLAKSDPRWARRLEPHDSWFAGSDVFYTYLVRNGCWRARREQRSPATFLDGAAEARARILKGAFPEFILRQFRAMLEYYGQSPIIVRSSSLLEDGFGNAFTGKYDSVFCPNQGSPDERLEAFLAAVRQVYASAMSEEALRYREHRGLLDRDEQMGILIQRVSGAVHGDLFFPQAAGVALSYNPWAWNPSIDPQAGMIRLVFGLGTRAVDRSDDDYTRVVALNAPLARPETSLDEVSEHAQRRVDVIDLARNRFDTRPFAELAPQLADLPVERFATVRRDRPPVLTFDKLLAATTFVEDVRAMVRTLAEAYRYPVDVEFTANFLPGGQLRLNLVQCRPLQVKEGGVAAPPPLDLPERAIVLASRGPVVGQSTSAPLDRVILVDPDAYDRLGQSDRYEVARVVGRLTRLEPAGHRRIMLLGPGRWGTSTIALGVPTSFAEIQRVSAIVEIVKAGLKVVPDVSLGSHFFNDLVESNMLYLAVYPDRPGYRLQEELLRSERNRLAELLPADARMAGIVRVVDFPLRGDGRSLWLNADCVRQEAVCYLAAPPVVERPFAD